MLTLSLIGALCCVQSKDSVTPIQIPKRVSHQGGLLANQGVRLGGLKGGMVVKISLEVVNNTSETLEVASVRGSCSCT